MADYDDTDGPKPKVNFAGTVPPEPANGLLAILPEIVANQGKRRLAVVEFDAAHTKKVTDTGQVIPTIRFRQIEPVKDGDVADMLHKIMTQAMADRGAQLTLDQAETAE